MGSPVSAKATMELGPFLGRLAALPDRPLPAEGLLSPVRLDLLTAVFERTAWLPAWQSAVASAERRVSAEIERRMRDAALESRFPAKHLARELPTDEDRAMLAARLSAAGIGYEQAVARLELPAEAERRDELLRLVCGELEAAWTQLVSSASDEIARWDLQAVRIRAWRRPWTPLIAGAALLLGVATWAGLVLGGYLNAPAWFRPIAEWVWSR